MDRIAFGDAPRRKRMADVMHVVQRHHRSEPGKTRRHHLRTAAEPGEEVRLDEAGGDADIGIQPCAIEEDLDARGRDADASKR